MKKYRLSIVLLAAVMLTGCSEKVTCSSQNVQDLVKKIERKQFTDAREMVLWLDVEKSTFSLDAIRTISNEDNKAVCQANMKIHVVLSKEILAEKPDFAASIQQAARLSGKSIDKDMNWSQEISYEARLTDDGKQVYVTVYDNEGG